MPADSTVTVAELAAAVERFGGTINFYMSDEAWDAWEALEALVEKIEDPAADA